MLTRATGPRLLPDNLNADPQRTRASRDGLESVDATTVLPAATASRGSRARAAVDRARQADQSP